MKKKKVSRRKKYELTDETRRVQGVTVHRIRAVRRFWIIRKGTLGGFVESERNLSHAGNCWIDRDAAVIGDARVIQDAYIAEQAIVSGQARIGGGAAMLERSQATDQVRMSGMAHGMGTADIRGKARLAGTAMVTDVTVLGGHVRGGFIGNPSVDKSLLKAEPR